MLENEPLDRFTYVTAHSPTLRRFTYVTAHSTALPLLHYVIGTSPTSPGEPPMPLWWFRNLQWLRPAGLYERCKFVLELKRLKIPDVYITKAENCDSNINNKTSLRFYLWRLVVYNGLTMFCLDNVEICRHKILSNKKFSIDKNDGILNNNRNLYTCIIWMFFNVWLSFLHINNK